MRKRVMSRIGQEEYSSIAIFIACWLMYTIACFGKMGFSTANVAIVEEGLFPKDVLGLIGTGFYLFYSVGQFFGGRLADKASQEKIVSIGLISIFVLNLVIVFSKSYGVMLASWSLNGLLQFGIWPATLAIVSTRLVKDFRNKAATYLAYCMPAGHILAYVFSSIILKYFHWKAIFLNISIFTLAILAVWNIITNKHMPLLKSEETKKVVSNKVPWKKVLSTGLIPLAFAGFSRSMLDLGVKAWVPTLLMETYGVSASFSSFLTIFLVLINILSVSIAAFFQKKFKGNEAKAAGVVFWISLPFALGLLAMKYINLYVAILLITVVTTLMSANNMIVVLQVPQRFLKFNCVGTMAGFINSISSAGTMAGTYVIGLIAENFGWTYTILSWVIIIFVSAAMCTMSQKKWQNFMDE